MEVAVENNTPLIMQISYELLRVVNRRMEELVRCFPPSVEITARKRTSVVTIDDSIRIEHGYNLEDKLFSEHLCFFIFAICKKEQHSSHHPGSHHLSGMDPCGDDNRFLGLHGIKISFGRDGEYLAVVSRERLTECLPVDDLSTLRILLDVIQVLHHVRVSVRSRKSKVDCIVVMGKFVRERGRVIALARVVNVLLNAIGIVAYPLSTLEPTLAFSSHFIISIHAGRFLLRVATDLHTIIEK